MWSLIIMVLLAHSVSITHVDNFTSKLLCKAAAIAVGKYAKPGEKIQESCVLEIP